ncbi:MAG: polyprenol monophosphomannose synthase [Nitrospiraceae bacterium]
MPNSSPASPLLPDAEQTRVRYYPVDNVTGLTVQPTLESGEAFVVPSFEVAEALIARGADSARIAISRIDPSDADYPGYAQAASNKPLVPVVPFRFDRSILIVLPTYNERENLEALVRTVGQYLIADFLIVDDNSPDGTGQLADELSRQHQHVHVLHRTTKEGLGPAYIAGFQWGLARGYQLMLEMDCDFSHPPWDLPRLVHRSRTADLVIGSRYIPGGGTENWERRRRLVSKLGNAYVQLFLGSSIHDWTGGFRCYRRELLADMNLETVQAKGYVFQVEMAWRACQLRAKICELPIRFSDRVQGQSKLGWPTIVEALREVPRMYFRARATRVMKR